MASGARPFHHHGARGRWERIERVAEARPWLRYVAVQDARTRPDHFAWNGTVLPWDHPFWRTHYPPNGWRCRCTVMQLSDDDLDEFGFDPSGGPPDGWDVHRPWHNRRTRQTVQVPRGIDPGFDHNPGLLDPVETAGGLFDDKLAAAGTRLAAAAGKRELDDWIGHGRPVRLALTAEAGGIEDAAFIGLFRAGLRKRLRDERGAGAVDAAIMAARGGKAAAERVRRAARDLPRSWVERGNWTPLVDVNPSRRGKYTPADRRARTEQYIHGAARIRPSCPAHRAGAGRSVPPGPQPPNRRRAPRDCQRGRGNGAP